MWYNQIVTDITALPKFIDYYYAELDAAKLEVKIFGSVEKSLSQLPGITEHRFNQLQEIEAVLPEVVVTRNNGYKAVNYEKIIPLLIEAIKELQKEVADLKNVTPK